MSTPSEAVERRLYNALWWAKVQSAGPLAVDPDTTAVAGLTRAAEPDGSTVWLVPTMPTGSGHAVLDELGTPPVAVEQPNETARVLAIVVACCWTDRSGSAWPGAVGTLTQVRAVYAGMRGRAEQSSDLTLIIGSLRRLHATHWIRWNEKDGEVRLGPRVINWTPADQATLRDLCRYLPDPPPAVLTTTPDTPTPDPLPAPDMHKSEAPQANVIGEAASAAPITTADADGGNAPADVSPVDSTSGEAAPADPSNPLGDSTSPDDDVREAGDE
ncbi:hypothetical protein ACFCV3_40845 [Kribbella sp. NPDC056345]|uniref:hypothetical protein n=1 Tax=Kribbella sp. NPDC056345 TaxID=3345789 RepID=UPI0035D7C540